ncbi:MAG: proline--tRNA ligase [Rheinheimera sp.]
MNYGLWRVQLYHDALRQWLENLQQIGFGLVLLFPMALPALIFFPLLSLGVAANPQTTPLVYLNTLWGYLLLLFSWMTLQRDGICGTRYQLYLNSLPTPRWLKATTDAGLLLYGAHFFILGPLGLLTIVLFEQRDRLLAEGAGALWLELLPLAGLLVLAIVYSWLALRGKIPWLSLLLFPFLAFLWADALSKPQWLMLWSVVIVLEYRLPALSLQLGRWPQGLFRLLLQADLHAPSADSLRLVALLLLIALTRGCLAAVNADYPRSEETPKDMEKVATPDQKTIADVAAFLNTTPEKCIKTLVFKTDDDLVVVLARGDHDINDVKVKHATGAKIVELAAPEEVQELLNCEIGSLGPIGLPPAVRVYADNAVKAIVNGVVGANENGQHLANVTPGKDFSVDTYADLRFIQEGDPSPDGEGTIQFAKGIEVGHIFKLGTTYSVPMKATFLNDQGRAMPYIMGCYGIGVSRVMAAVAEQFQDDAGFTWPDVIAPYEIHIVPVNMKDETQRELGEDLYKLLKSYRYEVLLDDRAERAGVKFADADLIGMPVRITVGKKASEGILEVKYRRTGETFEWKREELLDHLQQFFKK